jgi:hypothetical protein
LKQKLENMWENTPFVARYDMENEKERELSEFEAETFRMMEEDRPYHEIAQREEQLQNLRKAPPSFHGWWSKHGAPEDLPSWLQLPAKELYPRLLKQAGQGTKKSTRLRSSERFWEALILFYHEAQRLGIWSDTQIRSIVAQLTRHEDKLDVIKHLSSGTTTFKELEQLARLYQNRSADGKIAIGGRSRHSPYDLFLGPLDYWLAAAAVVELVAVKMRVDGILPAQIIKSIDEFAAAGQTSAQEP